MIVFKRKIRRELSIIQDKRINCQIRKLDLIEKMRDCEQKTWIILANEHQLQARLIHEYKSAEQTLINLL